MEKKLIKNNHVYSVQNWLPFKKVLGNRCN